MKYIPRVILSTLIVFLTACGGGGSGSDCNVAAGSPCGEGEYCAYVDNSCGANGAGGTCVAIPPGCTADTAPVCTCDGLSFINECFAGQAGQSVKSGGECA